MSNWTDGYVVDIDYTHGYYRQLSPGLLSFATLARGVGTRLQRPLRYLELGYGQGVSLAIHAAACEGEFWGTDFMPAHAANARELLDASGADAHVFDQSFEEFAARTDLPEFDIICLHGIWAWVSAANRAVIVDLLRRKLAYGGMVYVSYNCAPGYTPVAPLRQLLNLHADLAGNADAGVGGRIDAALDFARTVAGSGAAFFEQNPFVATHLEKIGDYSRDYLAHEYFGGNWELMNFAQVCKLLAEAKLDFAASARLSDHVDALDVKPEGQKFLAGVVHPVLRESVRDYLVNRRFRSDIFVKGARRLSPSQQADLLMARCFMLTTAPADIGMTIDAPAGPFAMPAAICEPLVEILAADDFSPKSLEQIAAHPALRDVPLAALVEVLLLLGAGAHVHFAQDADVVERVDARCRKLNAFILDRARYGAAIDCLASPVTGGGIRLSRQEQMFLSVRALGHPEPQSWAQFVWRHEGDHASQFRLTGTLSAASAQRMAELLSQAENFATKRLPILQALRIA